MSTSIKYDGGRIWTALVLVGRILLYPDILGSCLRNLYFHLLGLNNWILFLFSLSFSFVEYSNNVLSYQYIITRRASLLTMWWWLSWYSTPLTIHGYMYMMQWVTTLSTLLKQQPQNHRIHSWKLILHDFMVEIV